MMEIERASQLHDEAGRELAVHTGEDNVLFPWEDAHRCLCCSASCGVAYNHWPDSCIHRQASEQALQTGQLGHSRRLLVDTFADSLRYVNSCVHREGGL